MKTLLRGASRPWRWGCEAPLALSAMLLLAAGAATEAEFKLIEGIYEPSGATQLEDGTIVAVEDEPARPFSLLSPAGLVTRLSAQPLRSGSLLSAAFLELADLEGVAAGESGFAYAITSHSRKDNGKRSAERERLVRFRVEDSRITDLEVVTGLRDALVRAFPELDSAARERQVKRDHGLNLEGLTFGLRRQTLWIGFRGPLVKGDAMLVSILNPRRAFESDEGFRFGDRVLTLDLGGGGIRGLAYVPRLSGFLILSQRESGKKESPFKLWLWNGGGEHSVRRVRIEGVADLRRAEAVVPISLEGQDKLLLLSDDGSYRQRRPARYLLVDYAALRIDQE